MAFLEEVRSKLDNYFNNNSSGGLKKFSYKIKDPSDEDGDYSVKVIIKTANKQNKKDSEGNTIPEIRTVIARLSESFKLNLTSDWESLSSGKNGTVGALMDIGARSVFGTSLKTQILTAQTWSGNSPIEFTIPIELKAFSNVKKEVRDPMLLLMRSALPTVGNYNFLIPPGPNILASVFSSIKSSVIEVPTLVKGAFDYLTADSSDGYQSVDQKKALAVMNESRRKIGGNLGANNIDKGVGISLMLGKFFYIDNLIVTNVSCDIKNIMSNTIDPFPMSVECNVTFRTMFAPTTQDVEKWFLNNK